MDRFALRAHALGKRYSIGRRAARSDRLTEIAADAMREPFRRAGRLLRRQKLNPADAPGTFWALRDVSFEVAQGEAVGLIGRNGAGKSTLLKVLARITVPTTGSAEIRGRVGSLLEVGTGFHRDLTGRENVYLNGAILGMRRTEVGRKFDEIVAFSGVERFIDTPVKHYSSGMYLRLGFAVAAHLEPEVLLVDEILAVGDAEFQRKCLGKMSEVAHEGRTVVFVSHNLGAIEALCDRVLLVRDGTLAGDGSAAVVISQYLATLERTTGYDLQHRTDRAGEGATRVARVDIAGESDSAVLATGRAAVLTFHLSRPLSGLSCAFTIYDSLGQALAHLDSAVHSPRDERLEDATGTRVTCCIDELPLTPGRYRLNVAVYGHGALQDHIEGAAFFDVEPALVDGRVVRAGAGHGSLVLHHRWLLPHAR